MGTCNHLYGGLQAPCVVCCKSHLWAIAGNGARCTKCGIWEPLSQHPEAIVRWAKKQP